MANQYTKIPIPDGEKLKKIYNSGKTQKETGAIYGVSQKVIWSWFKKLNIKARIPKNRKQDGKNNRRWKGNEAGKSTLHCRPKKIRGKADRCEVCEKGKYFEWANLTGEYENINDYKMMCKSCHAKYDKKEKNFDITTNVITEIGKKIILI